MAACPGNSVFVFAFGLVFPYSLLFRMVSDCLFSYHRVIYIYMCVCVCVCVCVRACVCVCVCVCVF